MPSFRIRQRIVAVLTPFKNDRPVLFFFSTLILDFMFTIVGLAVVGPKWEMNSIYKSLWENRSYLTFVAFWLLNLVYIPIMFVFAEAKQSYRRKPGPWHAMLSSLFSAIIIYLALWRLYYGAIGWGIVLGCNYLSSVNACYANASSNPIIGLLNFLFPTSFLNA